MVSQRDGKRSGFSLASLLLLPNQNWAGLFSTSRLDG